MSRPNPIIAVVNTLRSEAKERARQEAKEFIDEARAALEEHGWNINAAAPYPMQMGHGMAYHLAREKHREYWAITKEDPSKGYQISNGRDPLIVVMDDAKMKKFIDLREEEAAKQYDAYVAKLVKKIGDVVWAELHGNHVWAHSILEVGLESGETQQWQTQTILNRSVYGRLFYQWPTRKLKKKVLADV